MIEITILLLLKTGGFSDNFCIFGQKCFLTKRKFSGERQELPSLIPFLDAIQACTVASGNIAGGWSYGESRSSAALMQILLAWLSVASVSKCGHSVVTQWSLRHLTRSFHFSS